MPSISLKLLLAGAALANAHNRQVADQLADRLVDKLVDKLMDRALTESPLQQEDMDSTTLGKSSPVVVPMQLNDADLDDTTVGMVTPSQMTRSQPQRAWHRGKPPQVPPGVEECMNRVRNGAASSPNSMSNRRSVSAAALGKDEPVVVIGVAADSGCGKSTFMRRLTNVFGGEQVGPLGGGFDNGGWETNTLVSDQTTVICLDDYHLNDRQGRKVSKRTALDTAEQKFDLMYEQIKALKNGESVKKPIYNHVNGTLDEPEEIKPTPILIIEGLHPFADKRVRELIDFSIYLDITDDVKFAWKVQRDMEERGHSLESIKASIDARKPDFDAYVAPQRADADLVIQVLPTDLVKDDTGKILKVKFIQAADNENYEASYIFDEGSTVNWVPCGTKLACEYPGISIKSGPEEFMGKKVSVLEMDGQFNKVDELCYVENQISNLDTKFYGELTEAMIKNKNAPGSNNGSGFFQSLASFKLRALYEKISGKKIEVAK
eukprot:gnl/TRDRNA2_/TRDRNA2_177365_c0_seq5.p1 gnl/TRDRNA2_/TRDRNA2_177365_c0~~gnl/TRDRNA2_/TRDRNA2_177365_c0_seq5.p1  ORF type:complete len:491 (+),score=120.51 gnl/TRDRNA2_/TRDRNA2_177365_c0_seq5:70-1542(+)